MQLTASLKDMVTLIKKSIKAIEEKMISYPKCSAFFFHSGQIQRNVSSHGMAFVFS